MKSNQPQKMVCPELSHLDLAKILTIGKSGCELAEIFFEQTHVTRIVYEAQKIDQVTDGTDQGVGIRLIGDGRSVYGYTTDLSQESLENLASSLAKSNLKSRSSTRKTSSQETSKEIPKDFRTPTSTQEMEAHVVLEDPKSISISERAQYAIRAEAAARSILPNARQITAAYGDSFRKTTIINSDGILRSDTRTLVQLYVQILAEKDGRVESATEVESAFSGLEFFKDHFPEDLGKRAAAQVKTLLSAKPAPSGSMPVVISSEAGGTMIHEAVGHGLEADLACNGLSVYGGKLGQQVASPLVTVVDDGAMPGRRGSFRCDDEGTASKKTVLIENGILKSYMVDRLSAMKFDLMATGNGRRESFRHKPIVRMTNTYIAPGKDDPAQILKDTKNGLFVKSMGGGQVNTVTGDFVFAVTEAYLIQDGKLGDPVRGATLVGNGPKVMSIIDRVGSDLGFAVGTCGKDGQGAPVTDAQPTVRIPSLTVGGEVPMDTYWKS